MGQIGNTEKQIRALHHLFRKINPKSSKVLNETISTLGENIGKFVEHLGKGLLRLMVVNCKNQKGDLYI